MSNRLIFLGMLALVLVCSACKKEEEEEPYFPSQLITRQFTSQALVGNAIGDPATRKMTIYTPEGYNPNGKEQYPVIYLLHGLPVGETSFTEAAGWAQLISNGTASSIDFPQSGFKAWIDSLITTGKIQPAIIVMPDATTAYTFSFYANSALLGNYEDYIAYDLVQYMDANFKTIKDRTGRAVIGFSQGGDGAIQMGLKHADRFSVVAAHGATPYFEDLKGGIPFVIAENPNGMAGSTTATSMTTLLYGSAAAFSPNLNNLPYRVDLPFEYPSGNIVTSVWNRWLEHDPYTQLNTLGNNLKTLNGFYFDVGTNDAWAHSNITFHNALTARGIPHQFETYAGDHFNKLYSRIEISLVFCANTMKH
ncbi:MAG: alpha/beta hydrolase-fold protein [Saprospiraceae bacterium]